MLDYQIPKKARDIIIYTDGACQPNPGEGGWAFIILDGVNEVVASGYEKMSTNSRMEINPVIEALQQLKEPYNIKLYSDSAYVVNTINKWLPNWIAKGEEKANMDLWRKFIEVSSNHYVFAEHVKGHSINPYNNRCDILAVNARKHQGGYYED